jgi:uncharacterized membrane protein YkvA (DUF1232 family)
MFRVRSGRIGAWRGNGRIHPCFRRQQAAQAKPMLERWKRWAGTIKRDGHALYLASRDPRVPWYAKAIVIAVAAYAASPIDLIPDFIPVVGYLDDLIIVPLGIALVVKLIPPEIMAEHRALATAAQDQPVSWKAAAVIAVIWALVIGAAVWLATR